MLKSTFAPPHVAALLVTAANAHGKRLLRRTGRDVLRVVRMAGPPLGNGWRHRLGLEAIFWFNNIVGGTYPKSQD